MRNGIGLPVHDMDQQPGEPQSFLPVDAIVQLIKVGLLRLALITAALVYAILHQQIQAD